MTSEVGLMQQMMLLRHNRGAPVCLCDKEAVQMMQLDDHEDSDIMSSHDHAVGKISKRSRSRSLPQEEFSELAKKLRDLERTDSGISRRTRDSGFNSEHDYGSFALSGCVGSDAPTGPDVASAIFNGGSNAEMLQNYGLDGPLVPVTEIPLVPLVLSKAAPAGSSALLSKKRPPKRPVPPAAPSDHFAIPSAALSSNSRKKRKEELKQATIRQHYYPEGGWGYVIVLVTFLSHVLSHGLQMSFGILMVALLFRFDIGSSSQVEAGVVGSLCISVSLLLSPLTVAICRRKSTRLTAVMGGLIAALGCLFTSFATQFHQVYFSYGIIVGIGIGMIRDTASLMVGQYFKRKRELVEVMSVASTGMGVTIMSVVIQELISSIGWRLGLQAVTGLISLTFFLGTFYRSASLYHPQRRAILHLKTQKRKIKSKDKEKTKMLQEDLPPFFDFSTLKSRTVQIMMLSTFLAFIGINAPILLMGQVALEEGLDPLEVRQIHIQFGVAFAIGTLIFGLVIIANSTECRIARQYLCQAALLLASLAIFSLGVIKGYNGYLIFVWIYGFAYGGYMYSFKLYIFQKVRARNFARAWGFAQFAMGFSNVIGVPITMQLNLYFVNVDPKRGFLLSAFSVLASCIALFLVDLHKRRLRKRKRKLEHSKSTISTATSFASTSCPTHANRSASIGLAPASSVTSKHDSVNDKVTSSAIVKASSVAAGVPAGLNMPEEQAKVQEHHQNQIGDDLLGDLSLPSWISDPGCSSSKESKSVQKEVAGLRNPFQRTNTQMSFPEQDDLIPPISLLSRQRSFLIPNHEEALQLLLQRRQSYPVQNALNAIFVDEAEDLDDHFFLNPDLFPAGDEDLILLDDLEFLENITSCAKVENCVMLSEFEQNLSKEKEEGGSSVGDTSDLVGSNEPEKSQSTTRGYPKGPGGSKSKKSWNKWFGSKRGQGHNVKINVGHSSMPVVIEEESL